MACGFPMPRCYVRWPSTEHLLIMITVLLTFATCSCGAPAANNRSCSHKEYAIFGNGKFITCRECPPCTIGTGLIKPCGTDIDIKDDIDCKPCPNGTYNDYDMPKVVMCKACNIQENKEVIKTCTSERNTEYGACIKGFYFREGEDKCVECSCCVDGSHTDDFVKKCSDDGLPGNMQCKQSGQLCPLISTTPATTLATIPAVTLVPPTQISLSEAAPNKNSESKMENNKQAGFPRPYWAIVFIPIMIVPVVLLIRVLVKHRRTSSSADGTMIEMQNRGRKKGRKKRTANLQQQDLLMNETSSLGWTSVEDISEQERTADPKEVSALISSGDPSSSEQTSVEDLTEQGQSGSGEVLTPADHPDTPADHNSKGIQWPQIPDCKLSAMTFTLKVYLSLQLDIQKAYVANWRDVAKEFKLNKDQLEVLEIDCQTPKVSPTESLFTILESRGSDEPSVKDLMKVLIKLQRSDIIENWDWEANKRRRDKEDIT